MISVGEENLGFETCVGDDFSKTPITGAYWANKIYILAPTMFVIQKSYQSPAAKVGSNFFKYISV